MIKASIIGATGYVGIELIRLLQKHPRVELNELVSNSRAGSKLIDVYPQFRGSQVADYYLKDLSEFEVKDNDIIFTALPHGVSQNIVAELFDQGVKIIDLSGDFRYHDTDLYTEWYGIEHNFPELACKAVYGLSEFNRSAIKKASLVANPGCYVTASLLALLPLVNFSKADLSSIIIDAKSGVSGAGKSLKQDLLFTESYNTMKAYSPGTHRHSSEIEYILNRFLEQSYFQSEFGSEFLALHNFNSANNQKATVLFTPHLVPVKRGIFATIYLKLNAESSKEELTELYNSFYETEKFIQLIPDSLPELKYVAGSNYVQLGFRYNKRTDQVIILSALDNMLKGAAGQAVQNMNIMFNLAEETGLEATALFP